VVPTPDALAQARAHPAHLVIPLGNKPTGGSSSLGNRRRSAGKMPVPHHAHGAVFAGQPKPAAKELRDQITLKIRDLESNLLKFAEIIGPPHAREPLTGGGPPP
jgi:hypothetical protein